MSKLEGTLILVAALLFSLFTALDLNSEISRLKSRLDELEEWWRETHQPEE